MAHSYRSPDYGRGLLLMDRRIASVSADSNATNAEPYADQPVASAGADMSFVSAGSDYDIEFQVQRAGAANAAGVVWREMGDAASKWRGADEPKTCWLQKPFLDETADVAVRRGRLDVLALDNGALIVVQEQTSDELIFTKATLDGTLTEVSRLSQSYAKVAPALVRLPSGRIQMYVRNGPSLTISDKFNVDMYFSDVEGETWTLGAQACLAAPQDLTDSDDLWAIRVGYHAGQFLLLAQLAGNTYVQYSSSDGAYFTFIEKNTSLVIESFGLTTDSRGFHFVACADEVYSYALLGAANQPISSVGLQPITRASDGVGFEGRGGDESLGCCVAITETGTIYAYLNADNKAGLATDDMIRIVWSDDSGVTWQTSSQLTESGLFGERTGGGIDTKPTSWLTACCVGQTVFLLVQAKLTYFENPYIAWLGGRSNFTIPTDEQRQSITRQYQPEGGFAAVELPTTVTTGWSRATTGTAPSEAITAGKYVASMTAVGDVRYSWTCDGSATELWIKVEIGGVTVNGQFVCELQLTTRHVSFEVQSSVARIRDEKASTTLDSDTDDYTNKIFFFYASESTGETKAFVLIGGVWTEFLSGTASSGSTLAEVVRWGAEAVGTGSSTVEVLSVASGSGRDSFLAAYTSPDSTLPIPVSGGWTALSDDLRIKAEGGIAYVGDSYTVSEASDYSVQNILPSVAPSPVRGWRSKSHLAALQSTPCYVVFDLSDAGDTALDNELFGIYLDGINFPEFTIEAYISGVWTELDLDTTNLLQFSYTRHGNVIIPSTSATDSVYLARDELKGASIYLGSTATWGVIGNSEGTLGKPGDVRSCRIFLDDATVSGGDATSGTATIVFPRYLGILSMDTERFSKIRIVIDSATRDVAADDFITIGQCVIGPIVVFGQQYEGRQRSLTPNVQISDLPDGQRRVRVAGKPRRSVTFSWPNGHATHRIYDAPVDSEAWVQNYNDRNISASRDVSELLEGLLYELDGAKTPVVYLPKVPLGAALTQGFSNFRAGGAIYGRITSALQIDTAQGDELEDELVRINQITVEEEL